jgi:hypothetical protein
LFKGVSAVVAKMYLPAGKLQVLKDLRLEDDLILEQSPSAKQIYPFQTGLYISF